MTLRYIRKGSTGPREYHVFDSNELTGTQAREAMLEALSRIADAGTYSRTSEPPESTKVVASLSFSGTEIAVRFDETRMACSRTRPRLSSPSP